MKVVCLLLFVVIGAGAYFIFDRDKPAATCKDCNLILITIDTLRADHLGFYGYSRNTSPFLDQFAKESIVFNNHITPRPKTGPSIASLFTGLYPNQHLIRNNREVLSNKIPTLSNIFKKNNFKTAAVISNIVLKQQYSGLDRDFDIYDINVDEPEINRPDRLQRNAEKTLDVSLQVIKKYKQDQFFIWIHLMDPHGPYLPPVGYRDHFKSDQQLLVENAKLPEYQLLPSAEVIDGLTDINHYVDKYDDEIRYLDIQLEKFFQQLKATGLLDKSLVVFSSDHGESLSEHEYYLEHGAEMYENNIRLPLAIRLPDSMQKMTDTYDGLTSSIDIFPTVADFFQLSGVAPTGGYNLFEFLQDSSSGREYTISESNQNNFYHRLAARNRTAKVISFGEKELCFDLINDPNEIAPVSCDPDPFPFLKEKLAAYKNDLNASYVDAVKQSEVEEKDIETLKSLGYF